MAILRVEYNNRMQISRKWVVTGSILLAVWMLAATVKIITSPQSITVPCRLENNAAWASVDWTSQPIDPAAVKKLAQDSAAHKIRYLFPFTTFVKENEFSKAHVYSAEFIREFRKRNTETKLMAWVGVPLKPTNGLGLQGWTDLNDAKRRKFILDFVKTRLIDEAGFDGIHFNVETVFDGNEGLPLLLEEAQETLGPDVIVSVSGENWLAPEGLISFGNRGWSTSYYQEVAKHADQIAVMTYDSKIVDGKAYQDWVSEQVVEISRSIRGMGAELLIGLSVSREMSGTHLPAIESVENALIGTCKGVHQLSNEDHPISGAAIYASWEVTGDDWTTWDHLLEISQP